MATYYGTHQDDYLPRPGDDNHGNDRFYAKGGNDTVDGGYGRDKIYGDRGNDYLYGGYDDDKIWGGDGHDWLQGEYGRDRLYGERGDDWLYGGEDDDKLYGGKGQDYLYGGEGGDRFVYEHWQESKYHSPDTIYDFWYDDGDRIDLSRIDANSHHHGDQAFHLVEGEPHAAGELGWTTTYGGGIELSADVNGGGADFKLVLSSDYGTTEPTDAWFIL